MQNTWKLATLGPGAMRDKKKPIKRPVELIVDHSDTGEGFGTMTYKGQRNLLLQARIKYPRSKKCRYPRYLTGLQVQVLGPDGKSLKSAWGDVGDGWSGWSPGVSVSVAISPDQAREQPGLYTVVFTKKMNLTPESKKPAFQHKKMMAVSVLVKAEGDRCCVGLRKSAIRNQRYVISCEGSTLINRIGKELPGGCDGLKKPDYKKIFGPDTRKKCEQYVKDLIGKGELGECFVGVKTDYQYMHALPCGRVLGTWSFSNGISAGFHANGTISGTYQGKWECLSQDPPKIMADWGGRGVAMLELSQDGKGLSGKDQYQRKLKATFRKLPTGFKLFKVQCNAKKTGDALPRLKGLGFKKVFWPGEPGEVRAMGQSAETAWQGINTIIANLPPNRLELKASIMAIPLALALLVLLSAPVQASHPPWNGKVLEVLAGGVISVMRDGEAIKVRLRSIVCPKHDQPYGQEAKKFTRDICLGKTVTVWPVTFDRSGQAWADVILPGGRWLNQELVRAGLAWRQADKRYSRGAKLASAEDEARKSKRGLWSDPKPVPPWK